MSKIIKLTDDEFERLKDILSKVCTRRDITFDDKKYAGILASKMQKTIIEEKRNVKNVSANKENRDK